MTDGLGYGWLGAKQRATLDSGLMLMGARVYNRVTGQFTSTDPILGGGATAYAYPVDPVNGYDLDGQHWCSWCKKKWKSTRSTVSRGWRSSKSGGSKTWRYAKRTSSTAWKYTKRGGSATWRYTKVGGSYAYRGGRFVARKTAPGFAVTCAAGAGWGYYRSSASGWTRAGDGVAGCF